MKKINGTTRNGAAASETPTTAKQKRMNHPARPAVPSRVRNLLELRRQGAKAASQPEAVVLDSRVLIVEGVAGSGKDTFQAYLKGKLKGRDIYDYSEGELLHSWKHFSIPGILKFRVQFEKLFITHVREFLDRNRNAVFLLNRFHLSTYVAILVRQPELARECEEVIGILKTLPVHVFILQLDEREIEQRSAHPERPRVWQDLQEQMISADGFTSRFEKYQSQQKLIIESAEKLQIPYSVIQLSASRREWKRLALNGLHQNARLAWTR
jgi:thymidylate kinase